MLAQRLALGTGKTTISTLLSHAYVERGSGVLAIDTDSNPNLAMSLGLDQEVAMSAPLVPSALAAGKGGGPSPGELVAKYGLATPGGGDVASATPMSAASWAAPSRRRQTSPWWTWRPA